MSWSSKASPQDLVLIVEYGVNFMYLCFQKVHLRLISAHNITPKNLGMIRVFFGKCELSCSSLLAVVFPLQLMDTILTQSHSNGEIMNTDLIIVLLGSSVSCCTSHWGILRRILVGESLLGRFTIVPGFVHITLSIYLKNTFLSILEFHLIVA